MDWLFVHAAVALLEGAAYAATGIAIHRRPGSTMKQYFVAWWAIAAVGMFLSASLLIWAAFQTPPRTYVIGNLQATFLVSAAGVGLLAIFVWFMARGSNRGWIAAPFVIAISIISTSGFLDATGVEVLKDGTRLTYDGDPPPQIFLQGITSIFAIGLGIWMGWSVRNGTPDIQRRGGFIAAAIVVYYVAKAVNGAVLTIGDATFLLLATRVAGMLSAYLGFRAYVMPPEAMKPVLEGRT